METALEYLSREDLLKVISIHNEKIVSLTSAKVSLIQEHDYLRSQVEILKRMQFDQKREHFEDDPNQATLPIEANVTAVTQQVEETRQKIKYVSKRSNHHRLAKLPTYLDVEEIEIYLKGNLWEKMCIGKKITEELECQPHVFFIKEPRLGQLLSILNEMGKWIFNEIKDTLPKSQTGKDMTYTRWDALSAYLYDGSLHIDNNLVENAIRSITLNRKNYLFVNSYEAAQRMAMIYSFFVICKKPEVKPFQWLKYTLENRMSINHKNIKDPYPQNFKDII